jgi:2,3-bisphosphoglycerate-dependent phosphoglycerate mutase
MMSNQGSGTVVWLIRHGQSTANRGGETTDPAMIPLSPTGERQALHVARVFDRSPKLIATSPFLRARQTAQATVDRFPSVRFEEWPIQEFTYLGRLHGRTTTGAQRRPLVDAYWSTADPSYHDDDRSESFVDVHARARRFLARLSRHDAGLVAVFTHGLFTRIVLWTILSGETTPNVDSMRRFHTFRTTYAIPNCSIIELNPHPDAGFRILGAAMRHIPPELHTGNRE